MKRRDQSADKEEQRTERKEGKTEERTEETEEVTERRELQGEIESREILVVVKEDVEEIEIEIECI